MTRTNGRIAVSEHRVCEIKLNEEQLDMVLAGLEAFYFSIKDEMIIAKREWGDTEYVKDCEQKLVEINKLKDELYLNSHYE